jgi:hypothetical protein
VCDSNAENSRSYPLLNPLALSLASVRYDAWFQGDIREASFCELREMTESKKQMKGDCINDFHCAELRGISLNKEFFLTKILVEWLLTSSVFMFLDIAFNSSNPCVGSELSANFWSQIGEWMAIYEVKLAPSWSD